MNKFNAADKFEVGIVIDTGAIILSNPENKYIEEIPVEIPPGGILATKDMVTYEVLFKMPENSPYRGICDSGRFSLTAWVEGDDTVCVTNDKLNFYNDGLIVETSDLSTGKFIIKFVITGCKTIPVYKDPVKPVTKIDENMEVGIEINSGSVMIYDPLTNKKSELNLVIPAGMKDIFT